MDRHPLQNRVTATSEIVAHPARGLFMGNRGILHDEHQQIGNARWRHKSWIICQLVWKNWKRRLMSPRAYTELFFLDEAVALAAGHRPCAMCRRPAFNAYLDAVGHAGSAKDLDRTLHSERAIPRTFQQRRHEAVLSDLPNGTIVHAEGPLLVLDDRLVHVRLDGYGYARKRPKDMMVSVLTPETSVNALKNGYRPIFHDSLG